MLFPPTSNLLRLLGGPDRRTLPRRDMSPSPSQGLKRGTMPGWEITAQQNASPQADAINLSCGSCPAADSEGPGRPIVRTR